MNTYIDIPELLNYPLPFSKDEVFLDEDFDLQEGTTPNEDVFPNAKKIAWMSNQSPGLLIGHLVDKTLQRKVKEWADSLFPDNFLTDKFYKGAIKLFPCTFIKTFPESSSRWHYEGQYPWTTDKYGPFTRTSAVLNFKVVGEDNSDVVFGEPSQYVQQTVESLYNQLPDNPGVNDVQWCKDKNIRSNLYSDAIWSIDEQVVEIDRKIGYESPFLLNLGHLHDHPNPWHRVDNTKCTQSRISFRLMVNEQIPFSYWKDLIQKGEFLKC